VIPSTATVIGAGVFGAWCAWFLSERHRVTLIDAYGPANARASSADHTRVIRCGYGVDEIYSRWAHASLADWRELERRVGVQLVVPSGALFLGPRGDDYVPATYDTLKRLGHAIDLIDRKALAERYPQVSPAGISDAVLEHDAGVIRARLAVQSLVQLMVSTGRVQYRLARLASPETARRTKRLQLASGETLDAEVVVVACGPWLPALFATTIGKRIRATRQEVLHFGVPPGDDSFALSRLPVWIDFAAGLYGIPDLDGHGFKVGIDRHGPAIDPDSQERLVAQRLVDRTRAFLAKRFPRLANAPLVDAHVCQYENTSSGDFLIDRHPHWPHLWLVGGGSGHGFKHGPAVGRYLADVLSGKTPAHERFSLTAKKTAAARAVY
jgi:sarcosine oxidase